MQISDKVLRVVKAEKISPSELQYMVTHAAITSLRNCNRRYFSWLFRVQGDRLLDMQHVDMIEIGSGETRMLEEHDECGGGGCRACGWVGHISRGVSDRTQARLDFSA